MNLSLKIRTEIYTYINKHLHLFQPEKRFKNYFIKVVQQNHICSIFLASECVNQISNITK